MTERTERERGARSRPGSDDPTDIASIAVHADDVVTALEARLRSGRPAVLRITPPFTGRMRARIHVEGGERRDYEGTPDGDGRPIHLDPRRLIEDPPSYPEVDETEDALGSQGEHTPETLREHHVAAVEAWREAVRASFVERVELETPTGPHDIEVKILG